MRSMDAPRSTSTPTEAVDAADQRMTLARALPANAGVAIAPADADDAPGVRSCTVADEPLANCGIDLRVKRGAWRREDAD